ncbi:hypothetical protein RB195_021856 [Necator americanus]|uniref:Uncharacterized protein n=1 Tax=Necator americanus TaxID=51031 RepID=A0ABR1ECY2_NECAM
MLFPASAASASTSALLSLRSSFIASRQSLASSELGLAYQLKSFKRQAPPGGFKTLSLLRAVVKVFDKPVIFLVDVVHCRIFPKAGQRSEEIPVDGSPGISLSELGGFLCSPCEGKSSTEEAMVRSRIELWYNTDVRQAEPFIDDDVVYFITVPSTG